MVKVTFLFFSIAVSLAFGSVIGYGISEGQRALMIQKLNTEGALSAATLPLKKLDRAELERRFTACIGRSVRLSAYTDIDLNNDLHDCEQQKK